MKDPISRRSRGFGFITFEDLASVDNALAQTEPHEIDSRKVEAKRAVPRSEVNRNESSNGNNFHERRGSHNSNHLNQNSVVNNSNNSNNQNQNTTGVINPNIGMTSRASRDSLNSGSIIMDNSGMNADNGVGGGKPGDNDAHAFNKIFVGGLHYDTRDAEFRSYFEKYGKVISAEVMFNRETHKSRGFGFIVFEMEDSIDRVCAEEEHTIDKKVVEVKRAIPRSRLGSSDSGNDRPRAGSQSSHNSNSMIIGIGLGPTPGDSISNNSNSVMKNTTTTGVQPKSDIQTTTTTAETSTIVVPTTSGVTKSTPVFSYAAALKAGASNQATPAPVATTTTATAVSNNTSAKMKDDNTSKKDVTNVNNTSATGNTTSDTPIVETAPVPNAPLSFASIAGGKSSKRNAQSPWTANTNTATGATTTANTTVNTTTTADSSKTEGESRKSTPSSTTEGAATTSKTSNKGDKTTGVTDKTASGNETTTAGEVTATDNTTSISKGNKSNNNTNKDEATTEAYSNMRAPVSQGQPLQMQMPLGNMQQGGQLSMEQMQANQLQLLLAQQNEVEGRLSMLESQGNTMENNSEIMNLRRYLSEVMNMIQQMYALQNQMRGNGFPGLGHMDGGQMGHHGIPHGGHGGPHNQHSPPHAQNSHHQQRLPQWAGGMNGRGGYQNHHQSHHHHQHQHQNHQRMQGMQGMMDMNSMSSPLGSSAWIGGMGGMIKPLDDYGTPSASGLGGDYGGGLQFGVGGTGQDGQYGGMGYGVGMGSAWGPSDRDGPVGTGATNNGPQYPGSNVLFGKHSAGGSGLTGVGISTVGQTQSGEGEYSNSMANAIRGSLMSQGGGGDAAVVAGGASLSSDQDDMYSNVNMPPFFGDLSLGNPAPPPAAAPAASTTAPKNSNSNSKK